MSVGERAAIVQVGGGESVAEHMRRNMFAGGLADALDDLVGAVGGEWLGVLVDEESKGGIVSGGEVILDRLAGVRAEENEALLVAFGMGNKGSASGEVEVGSL